MRIPQFSLNHVIERQTRPDSPIPPHVPPLTLEGLGELLGTVEIFSRVAQEDVSHG